MQAVLDEAATNVMMINGGSAVPLWNTWLDAMQENAAEGEEMDDEQQPSSIMGSQEQSNINQAGENGEEGEEGEEQPNDEEGEEGEEQPNDEEGGEGQENEEENGELNPLKGEESKVRYNLLKFINKMRKLNDLNPYYNNLMTNNLANEYAINLLNHLCNDKKDDKENPDKILKNLLPKYLLKEDDIQYSYFDSAEVFYEFLLIFHTGLLDFIISGGFRRPG